jgi:hypothetical protein
MSSSISPIREPLLERRVTRCYVMRKSILYERHCSVQGTVFNVKLPRNHSKNNM